MPMLMLRGQRRHLEIARSRSDAASTAHPSSPEYAPEDLVEGDAEVTNADGEAAEDADDDDAQP